MSGENLPGTGFGGGVARTERARGARGRGLDRASTGPIVVLLALIALLGGCAGVTSAPPAARAPGRAGRLGGAGRGGRRAGRAPRRVRGGRAADLGHRHPGRRARPHRHPRPDRHPLDQRHAGLRHRVPGAGRRRRRARRPRRPARPDLPHRRARADPGDRQHPAHRRPDRRRRHADLDHLRRAGHRPRRGRTPRLRRHLGAHRGLLPLDVRRAAQLAPEGVLAPRHPGHRRGAPVRRRQRRGPLRRRGPLVLLHRRPRPARPRRRERPHPRALPGRAAAAEPSGVLRPRHLPDPVRRARRVREARGQADALGHVGRPGRGPARVLRPEPAARRAHLEQRRVRARQPGLGQRRRVVATSRTAASTCPRPTASSSTTGSRWATRWRSSAPAAR